MTTVQAPIRPTEAKIRQPKDFDGSSITARKFFFDCKIYLNLNQQIYDTDEKKIAFVLSFCNEGTAAAFAENYYTLGLHASKTFTEFEADFNAAFLSSDTAGDALQELKQLKQTGTGDEYVAKFKILVTRAGISQYEALRDYFEQGLSQGLRQRIYNLTTLPDTMAKWYEQAQRLDNQWRRSNLYSPPTSTRLPFPRRDAYPPRNRPQVAETSTRIRSLPLEDFLEQFADDIYANRLSTADREHFFKENRCFRCGNTGHIARNCTNRQLPSQSTSNRTNTRPPIKKNIRSLAAEENQDTDDFEDISLEDRTQYIRGLLTGLTDDDYNQIVDSIQESENFRED